jgi:hypothetical protein
MEGKVAAAEREAQDLMQLIKRCSATVVTHTPAQALETSSPPADKIFSTTPPAQQSSSKCISGKILAAVTPIAATALPTFHRSSGMLRLHSHCRRGGVVQTAQALVTAEEQSKRFDESGSGHINWRRAGVELQALGVIHYVGGRRK